MTTPAQAPAEAPATPIEPHLLAERVKLPAAATEVKPDPAAAKPSGDPAAPADPVDPNKPAPTEPEKPAATPPGNNEQLEAMMRKSRDLQTRDKKIKESEDELAQLRELKKRVDSKDYGVMTDAGGSLQEWSDSWLKEQGEKPTNPLEAELRETQTKLAEFEKWRASQTEAQDTEAKAKQRRDAEAAHKSYNAEIKTHIDTTDGLEMLRHADLGHEVFAVIQQHAQRTQEAFGEPKILEIGEAAKVVNKYYVPKMQELVKNLSELPDFKETFDEILKARAENGGNPPPETDPAAPTPDPEAPKAKPGKTLTASQGATAPPRAVQPFKDRDERLKTSAATLVFVDE